MLDSQNNTTLVAENASFNFKQNVETQASCVYQQLNNVKSVQLFVIKPRAHTIIRLSSLQLGQQHLQRQLNRQEAWL